jgi:hypothetical protein
MPMGDYILKKNFCTQTNSTSSAVVQYNQHDPRMASSAAKSTKVGDMNIQTFLRIKPSKRPSGYFQADDVTPDTSLCVRLPDDFKAENYVDNSKLNHKFQFSGLLDMKTTQEDVFQKVGMPAIANALEGYNSTIFAYGQTGMYRSCLAT